MVTASVFLICPNVPGELKRVVRVGGGGIQEIRFGTLSAHNT